VDLHYFRKLEPDPHKIQSSGVVEALKWSHGGPWTTLTIYKWRLKMELWKICRLVVADSHLFDEKHDPDPHQPDSNPQDFNPSKLVV
jgi:hypothetical protein